MRKAAIIGAGAISGFHGDAWHHLPGVELCAVCDQDLERARALAEKFGGRVYANVTEMLSAEKPEMVSLCLPTFLHREYACLALEAGCHVLCEKPMALTMQDCEQMAETARRTGRVLMVGQVLRFWPEYVTLRRELLRLGKPDYLFARRIQHSSRGGGFHAPNRSGGALYDLLVHDLDFVSSLWGVPELVSANGNRGPEGSWRRVNVSLRLPSGPFIQLEACNRMPAGFPFTVGFRAEYPEAALDYRFQTATNIGLEAKADSAFFRYERGEIIPLETPADAQTQAFRAEIAAFAQGCAEGRSPIPPEETLQVMERLHEMEKALEEKC